MNKIFDSVILFRDGKVCIFGTTRLTYFVVFLVDYKLSIILIFDFGETAILVFFSGLRGEVLYSSDEVPETICLLKLVWSYLTD